MRMTEQEAIQKIKEKHCTENQNCTDSCMHGVEHCAYSMAIKALEKQIPKKPKHVYIHHGKHKWRTKENGEVDDFAWDTECHNGVECEVCGDCVCVFCNPDYDEQEDCEENYWLCPACDKKVFSIRKICDCGQILDWSKE